MSDPKTLPEGLSAEAVAEKIAQIEAQIEAHKGDAELVAALQAGLEALQLMKHVELEALDRAKTLAADTVSAVEAVDPALASSEAVEEELAHPFADGADGLAKVDYRIPGARYVKDAYKASVKLNENESMDEVDLPGFIEIPQGRETVHYLIVGEENEVYVTTKDPRTKNATFYPQNEMGTNYEVREGVICLKSQEEAPVTLRQLREQNFTALAKATQEYTDAFAAEVTVETIKELRGGQPKDSETAKFVLEVPSEDPDKRAALAHSLAINYLNNDLPEKARQVWADVVSLQGGIDRRNDRLRGTERTDQTRGHFLKVAKGNVIAFLESDETDLATFLESERKPMLLRDFAALLQDEKLPGYGELDVNLFVDIVIEASKLIYKRAEIYQQEQVLPRLVDETVSATRVIDFQFKPSGFETPAPSRVLAEILQTAGIRVEVRSDNLMLPAPDYLNLAHLRAQAKELRLSEAQENVFDAHLEKIRTALKGAWAHRLKSDTALEDRSFEYLPALKQTIEDNKHVHRVSLPFESAERSPDTPVFVFEGERFKASNLAEENLDYDNLPANKTLVVMDPMAGPKVFWSSNLVAGLVLEGDAAGAGTWSDAKKKKVLKAFTQVADCIGVEPAMAQLNRLFPNDLVRRKLNPYLLVGETLLEPADAESDKEKQKRLNHLYVFAQAAREFSQGELKEDSHEYNKNSKISINRLTKLLLQAPDAAPFVHQFAGWGCFSMLNVDAKKITEAVNSSADLMEALIPILSGSGQIKSDEERLSLWKDFTHGGGGVGRVIEDMAEARTLSSNLALGVEGQLLPEVAQRQKENFESYVQMLDWAVSSWEIQLSFQNNGDLDTGINEWMQVPHFLTTSKGPAPGRAMTPILEALNTLAGRERMDSEAVEKFKSVKARYEELKAT